MPPWINKYYILDLTPEKSFVKWTVEQGFTVFLVSWVNPDARLAQKTFEDYMHEGILPRSMPSTGRPRAARSMRSRLSRWAAPCSPPPSYMAAKDDDLVASATFLTAQVDFSEAVTSSCSSTTRSSSHSRR